MSTRPPEVWRLVAVALVLALGAGSGTVAWGRGAAEQAPHWVVRDVREVDLVQKRLLLSDGIEVFATDPRQLDGIVPGTKVRVRIEMTQGRRTIYAIEKVSP